MSRNYNTRQSAAQFMSHGEQEQQEQINQRPGSQGDCNQQKFDQNQQFSHPNNLVEPKSEEMIVDSKSENSEKPHWMKKLTGVKKITNKERRRRQNQHLRRLVTPKSALMVLNEMVPGDQLVFKVDNFAPTHFYHANNPAFCAEVTVDGNTFKGYGDTKTSARNAAAEQAVRDIILKKMVKSLSNDHKANEAGTNGDEPMETAEEEPMPMIQLASFALHKLFSEWEGAGHRVPQLRPGAGPMSEWLVPSAADGAPLGAPHAVPGPGPAPGPAPPGPPKVKKEKVLPETAAEMHPCMLLTYMRPLLEYREVAVQGDRPQNLVFVMSVEVDGTTFVGKGPSKKEARKQAAMAACRDLFGVTFN